jgi:hypothetical protein
MRALDFIRRGAPPRGPCWDERFMKLQIWFRDDEDLYEELVNTYLLGLVVIAPKFCK